MPTLFYFEQQRFDGTYSPATSPSRPSARLPSGVTRKIRAVSEVNKGRHHLSLKELEHCYGTNRKFHT